MSQPVLACRGASRMYGDRLALDDVSLTVDAGQILAVLGPNGAGKSTLVRLCAGLIGLTSGSVSVLGLDVGTEADQVRRHVGLVTGDAGFYDGMSVQAYLTFFARSYGMDRAAAARRVGEVLEQVRLPDRATSKVGALSQGLRQRVSLARALVHEPALLLLDEATNGLDPEASAQLRAEIAQLRSSARAIVLCTHLLHEADALADRVVILQDGRAIADETPGRLKKGTGSSRRVLVELGPGPAPDLSGLAALGAVQASLDGPILRYVTEDPAATNPRVLAALTSTGSSVIQLTVDELTLEAAYLARVRRP